MHIPVLLQLAIENLQIREGDTYLDCTVGSGGHSLAVCSRWGKKVKIVGLDLDRDAIDKTETILKNKDCNFILKEGSFQNLDKILGKLGIKEVDRILMDLGWSQDQLEKSGRGFSFLRNEPLLMTLKKKITSKDLTAGDIVNLSKEEDLAMILSRYGEEGFAGKIARKIVERRKEKPLETTFDLVKAVEEAVPAFYKRGRLPRSRASTLRGRHPATKTFQALRIAVNDELEVLKIGLGKGFKKLSLGGRLAVISFHSLEDRIVKNFFRDLKKSGEGRIITKKPIVADRQEIRENPRSRSAKLRVLEKIN